MDPSGSSSPSSTQFRELVEVQIIRNRILTGVLCAASLVNAGLVALIAAGVTGSLGVGAVVLGVVGVVVICTWLFARSRTFGGRPPSPAQRERLEPIVRTLAGRFGMEPPRVYVIEDPGANAFAFESFRGQVVFYSTGLLDEVSDPELEAITAHELAHLANHDTRVAILATALWYWACVIDVLAVAIAAGLFEMRKRIGDDDDVVGAILSLIFKLMFVLLSATVALFGLVTGIVAKLLRFALIRQREWMADATAARIVGTPDPLCSALWRLDGGPTALARGGQLVGDLCLVGRPPLGSWWTDLLQTHPSTGRRVQRLQALTSGGRDPAPGLGWPITAAAACALLLSIVGAGVVTLATWPAPIPEPGDRVSQVAAPVFASLSDLPPAATSSTEASALPPTMPGPAWTPPPATSVSPAPVGTPSPSLTAPATPPAPDGPVSDPGAIVPAPDGPVSDPGAIVPAPDGPVSDPGAIVPAPAPTLSTPDAARADPSPPASEPTPAETPTLTPTPDPTPESTPSLTPVSIVAETVITATSPWVDTGIDLRAGQSLTISARGTWFDGVGPWTADGRPEGSPDNFLNLADLGVCPYCATTKTNHFDALIAYIGTSPPQRGSYAVGDAPIAIPPEAQKVFIVGSDYRAASPLRTGRLWLIMNSDAYSSYTVDNSGQVTATITVTGTPTS